MECYRCVLVVVVMTWVVFYAVSGVPVRLVQTPVPHAGRVEVQYQGIWGSICDDYWNLEDAHVICRQLNYTGALMSPCCSVFGFNKTSKIWLDDVNCHGNENDVSQCRHRPWGVSDCTYYSQASVVCVPNNYTKDYKFRLAGGSVPYAGRVEVLHAGVWGDIDNIGWDITDGHVICRSLGYSRAVTVIYRSQQVFRGLKGVIKWFKHVDCRGNESSLSQCPFVMETERVSYGFDAGVVCEPKNGTNVTDVTFRLKTNVNALYAGRIEAFFANMWGVINYHKWDMTSAHVICRQLGYAGAEMVIYSASNVLNIRKRSLEWVRDVQCSGTESSLAECNYTIQFDNDGSEDAGVVCTSNKTDILFRLAGGNIRYGRVETYYAGVWGTVNNRGFDIKAATVVCNHLGFSGIPSIIKFAVGPFGPGTGPVWLTDLSCHGNETSLWECHHSKVFKNFWSHDYDVGVVCNVSNIDSFTVRLSQSSYGRVELSYLGVWGTISGTSFNKSAADVICRQLGFPSSLASFDYGAFGAGGGPVWLSGLTCNGNESNIGSCFMDGFSLVYPSHVNDASVVCKKDGITYQDYSVRLRGGSLFDGRVEIQFKGVWGSVVHVLSNEQSRVGHVICRQLGFTGIDKTISDVAAIYGSGTGPVWMTHVRCHGNETSLGDCTFEKDFHGRYPEFGVICNKTRLPLVTTTSQPSPSTTPSTTVISGHSTPVPSILSRIVMIGLPVLAGIAGLVVVLVCVVKLWRHNHRKYTTGNEFVRMDESARGRRDVHSFRNIALEMEDERRDWLEIPRNSVTQVEEIRSEKNVTVHRGQLETDGGIVRTCLVKSIRGSDDDVASNSNELKTIYRLAKHPNILYFIGACSMNGPLLLVFEFPECGSLLQYLRKHQTTSDANDNQTSTVISCSLPKVERLRLALEIATGMKWLAQQNVVHGCLSAKSVYLGKNGSAKIGNIASSSDSNTTKNDHRWMAPETIESSTFSSKSDVWSYGVLLWEIETGGLVPYSEFDEVEIYPKIKSGYKLPRPANTTDSINSLIMQCIRSKPDQRPDFSNICDRLDATISEETAC